jgi:hypothetical protein
MTIRLSQQRLAQRTALPVRVLALPSSSRRNRPHEGTAIRPPSSRTVAIVWLAGMGGITDADGKPITDFAGQTRRAFPELRRRLKGLAGR